jgi:hypothetical protein
VRSGWQGIEVLGARAAAVVRHALWPTFSSGHCSPAGPNCGRIGLLAGIEEGALTLSEAAMARAQQIHVTVWLHAVLLTPSAAAAVCPVGAAATAAGGDRSCTANGSSTKMKISHRLCLRRHVEVSL